MKIENLLPIGSVVRLTDAKKKVVIMGIMPVKHMPDVPYPEGYMTQETGLLFNHDKIDEIIFEGYANEERKLFMQTIQQIVDVTDKVVK